MIKSQKLLSIGEVAKYLNIKYPDIKIKTHTLRFWEQNFKNIKPYRIINKRKYYNDKSVIEIEKIVFLLKQKKYSLNGAKIFLETKKLSLDEINENIVDRDKYKTNIEFKIKLLNNKIKNLKKRWQKKAL